MDLTAAIVATRRDEEKALLASDEAVAHALKDKHHNDIKVLDRLIEKPYFARLLVEEQLNGQPKEMEYRIGVAANTDCRIIDWRKAPISKLYYEYREGDEYSEEIQGRERSGRIKLRNSVEIEKRTLKKVTCRHGTAVKDPSGWRALGSGTERAGRSYSQLPGILPLITPDQFRTITEDASAAILIQGIAGSGKTTVALHRLAWLLHADNLGVPPSDCLVIALSRVLKGYIERTLKAMDIEGVAVLTFEELAGFSVARLAPAFVQEGTSPPKINRSSEPTPATVDRVKRSLAVLKVLEELAVGTELAPADLLPAVLARPHLILAQDESKLLNADAIVAARARTVQNLAEHCLDQADDALLLRVQQVREGSLRLHTGSDGLYKQLVVDEVQEFSPAELACIVSGVQELSQLTLVGDTAQRMSAGAGFPGWEKLRAHWDDSGSLSHFVSLTVSHRSTIEIMRLADYIQKRAPATQGRNGRIPIWFQAKTEAKGIQALIDWLGRAIEKYPDALTAVICRTHAEAKLAQSFLVPTFGSAVRLGDDYSFSFDEGIVVTDVVQAKGLEFLNVAIWNPSMKTYPQGDESRNALYVAVSRAEENLCIATWQRPSVLLPPIRSHYVRGYELDLEEEEGTQQG